MAEEDAQWTVVMHKSHHRSNKLATKNTSKKGRQKAKTSSTGLNGLSSSSSDTVDQRDLDKCLKTVETFRVNWTSSPQGRHLRHLLLTFKCEITNAIIVGLGNVDPNSIRDRFRATWQLAVFLEMVQTLIERQDKRSDFGDMKTKSRTLPLFAQDPAFTRFDEALLSSLSIEVQRDAMQACHSRTLLFVPFVDAVVLLPKILNGKDPELYIGTDVRLIIEKMSMPTYAQMGHIPQSLVDESLTIASSFLKGRERLDVDFNGFGELSLYGLSMYSRSTADAIDAT